jgi:hypothetical protein
MRSGQWPFTAHTDGHVRRGRGASGGGVGDFCARSADVHGERGMACACVGAPWGVAAGANARARTVLALGGVAEVEQALALLPHHLGGGEVGRRQQAAS